MKNKIKYTMASYAKQLDVMKKNVEDIAEEMSKKADEKAKSAPTKLEKVKKDIAKDLEKWKRELEVKMARVRKLAWEEVSRCSR